jgi:CheY-like chemotaxis protein
MAYAAMTQLLTNSPHPRTDRPLSLRVLVVDDYPDAAESLALLLRLWGYDAQTAASLPAALETAQVYQPDVVISEVCVQNCGGYELPRYFREGTIRKQPAFIAFTTQGREADRNRATEAGYDHHLTKPLEPNALKELLLYASKVLAAESH